LLRLQTYLTSIVSTILFSELKKDYITLFIISIQENDSNMIVDCIKIFVAYFEMWQKKNEFKLIDWAYYDFFSSWNKINRRICFKCCWLYICKFLLNFHSIDEIWDKNRWYHQFLYWMRPILHINRMYVTSFSMC
jgi:hypothetical protein